ncbi:MAG: hypothetical protein ACHQX1_01490, partial [Candidatus Micrarchaeales archaeon]
MKLIYVALIVIIVIALALFYYLLNSQTQSITLPKGVKFSQQYCMNAVPNITAMRIAINAGIMCYRTDISLNPAEENFVANLSKSGASFLGILDYDTVGAVPSPQGCVSGCNWTLSDWNASVYNAMIAYPEITTWEIWNEPFISNYRDGYQNGSALNYFNLVRSAYTIIKSKEPNSTIVCFGGAQLFPNQTVSAEYQFYEAVWGYGVANYCDAVSVHSYGPPQGFNYSINLYENLTHKPIW